jgi:hypothetical protein
MVVDVSWSAASCASGSALACLSLDDWEDVEVVARRDGEVTMRWVLLSGEGGLAFPEAPDCLELRRRSPTGRRSEPLVICGDAFNTRSLRDEDLTHRNLTCSEGTIEVSDASGHRPPDARSETTEGADAGVAGDDDPGADSATSEPSADGCSTLLGSRHASNPTPLAFIAVALLALVRGSRPRGSLPRMARCRPQVDAKGRALRDEGRRPRTT